MVCQHAVLFPAHAIAYCDLRDLLEELSNVQAIWARLLAAFRKQQQKRVEGIANSLRALKERSIYPEGIPSTTGDDPILDLLKGRLSYRLDRLTATIVHWVGWALNGSLNLNLLAASGAAQSTREVLR